MTDRTFIHLLKSHYKRYFESGESVGMEFLELVELFRKEIEDEIIEKRKSEMTEKLKDFVSLQKPKRESEPFFGFFQIPEKGINGTGEFYQKKKQRNEITLQRKESRIDINKRFEKYYQNKE